MINAVINRVEIQHLDTIKIEKILHINAINILKLLHIDAINIKNTA